jgi:hypothetical protein
MAVKQILLTIEKETFTKLKKKASKLGYLNPQQYILEMIRRNVFYNKSKTKKYISSDEELLNKFSKPTKKSKRIERWAKKYRIGY